MLFTFHRYDSDESNITMKNIMKKVIKTEYLNVFKDIDKLLDIWFMVIAFGLFGFSTKEPTQSHFIRSASFCIVIVIHV